MTVYPGPPPPSGTVQSMYSSGILMEQHLQWMQFCALITLSRGRAGGGGAQQRHGTSDKLVESFRSLNDKFVSHYTVCHFSEIARNSRLPGAKKTSSVCLSRAPKGLQRRLRDAAKIKLSCVRVDKKTNWFVLPAPGPRPPLPPGCCTRRQPPGRTSARDRRTSGTTPAGQQKKRGDSATCRALRFRPWFKSIA